MEEEERRYTTIAEARDGSGKWLISGHWETGKLLLDSAIPVNSVSHKNGCGDKSYKLTVNSGGKIPDQVVGDIAEWIDSMFTGEQ